MCGSKGRRTPFKALGDRRWEVCEWEGWVCTRENVGGSSMLRILSLWIWRECITRHSPFEKKNPAKQSVVQVHVTASFSSFSPPFAFPHPCPLPKWHMMFVHFYAYCVTAWPRGVGLILKSLYKKIHSFIDTHFYWQTEVTHLFLFYFEQQIKRERKGIHVCGCQWNERLQR